MRKKSLRAMESAVFQAPESRAEAIMQNILGANNVLVPPEAPFEEILQAILYDTPYTKEAEARIEEILLAIKNNGTYHGEPQSRDEEILISKLNQTPYTKDAESRIEELFILWAAQSIVKQLEGVPPLTFTAQGQPLINWTIYGTSGGVGDKTANLFDWNWLVNGFHLDPQTGLPTTHPMRVSILQPIDVSQLTTATISYESIDVEILYAMYSVLTTENTLIRRATNVASGSTLNLSGGDKLYIAFYNGAPSGATAITKDNITNIMLNTGETPLPYEPFGYKIPISCGGETKTIYLDTPLYDGNSISMADTGIEIPTTNGQNTLAVDTTVQPEKVYIEYK